MIVCGYIPKENHMISAVLGQYGHDGGLKYKGHVTLGVRGDNFRKISAMPKLSSPSFDYLPEGNENATWIEPSLVCIVEYMNKTTHGGMRQLVFKGLRFDKEPEECVIE